MNRRIAGLGLVTATFLLAHPAHALPDLVSSDTPSGWSYPALPRSSGDASSGSCVLQAPALPGESTNSWFNGSMHNIGNATASGTYTALYLDDVLKTIQGPYNVLAGGFGLYTNNHASVNIKGGRHTLLSRADAFGGVSENSETNNDWTRQYIWSPLALTAGSPVTRTGDPGPYSTGSGPWLNCEGFSGGFSAGNWWYAFAVLGVDGSDIDVTLHTEAPSNVPQAGFGAYTAFSNRGGDCFDAVIINKNLAPIQTYYAGVSQFFPGGNKVVQFEASPVGYISSDGVYGPFTMGAGDIVDLQEIYGYTSNPVSIEIRPVSGTANLSASLIGQVPGGQSTIFSGVPGGWADNAPAGGIEGMGVVLTSGAYHGLVVYKHDSSDISKSCTYNIVITQLSNLVADRTPPGWSGPVVPRNAPDASGYVATLPPTLNGNQATTSFNFSTFNSSFIVAVGDWSTHLFVDDESRWFGPNLLPFPPQTIGVWMNTYIGESNSIVRGGRHFVRTIADGGFELAESAEWDNEFTDWFVWTPLELANQVPGSRYAPPYAWPVGSSAYPACDGLRSGSSAGAYWLAVAAMPASMSSEYDVLLHAPSTGSKNGFGDALAYSYDSFPGNPDFCIVNYNVAPFQPYDFSVTNQWGYSDQYYYQQANAPYELVLSPGVSQLTGFSLDTNDILDMHEFYVDPSVVGQPVLITVKNLYGGADLEAWLFNGSVPYHTKFTAMASANANGPGGNEVLGPVVFGASGFYALVVNKSKATDMGHAAYYDLEFVAGPIPNLITAATPPGWSSPVVPRNTTDATPTSCLLPPVLTGNAMTTSFNFSSRNSGIGDALPTWSTWLSVDEEPQWQGNQVVPLAPSNFALWNNTTQGIPQSLVRGGRHHVRLFADQFAQVSEISEVDNDFTDWFVWSPLVLANQTPVLRSAPPQSPVGSGPYPSCDGVRSSGFSGAYWTAVGVMPTTMFAEYDLAVHAPSTGSKDGFAAPLALSYDMFNGNPDFCIVNYNAASVQPYDFGVTNSWGYADSFYVQQADAPFELSLSPGLSRLGPFSLAASDILDMHEFYVAPGLVGTPVYISVNNLSGGVDLELWLFNGATPFHTKFTAMAGVNSAGVGGDEHLVPISFATPGYYALVVNKSKATDMGHAASYEIVFKTGTSAVDAPVVAALPTEFALSSPRPNPSSSGTSVELAVPAGHGKATVAVYDLAGRRVRSLVDGESTPGRHLLTWDGRDSAGLKAAAGVYFVRLETADRKESKKITLLR